MAYQKYFTISYDDGLEQDKKIIQILREFGLKGTFNLNSGMFGERTYIGRKGDLGFTIIPEGKQHSQKYLHPVPHFMIPENEIKQVYEGFEVATHGWRHEFYYTMSQAKISESIRKDREALSKLLGYEVVGHAYPKGALTKKSVAALKENGMVYGRGVKSTKQFTFPENPLALQPTCWHADEDVFELLDRFIQAEPRQEDMLFYMWGHGYEFDYGTERNNWDRFKRICEKIANRDDIISCTNLDAIRRK